MSHQRIFGVGTDTVIHEGDKTVKVVGGVSTGVRVYTVPAGTPLSGSEPDGSLWVEYEQA